MLLPRGRSFQLGQRDSRERRPEGSDADAPFTVYRSYQSGWRAWRDSAPW
jgi:hypothetical protein